MQIKIIVKLYLTPVRMAIIMKTNVGTEWTEGTVMYRWWGGRLLSLLWKSVWRFCCYFQYYWEWGVYLNSFSGNLLLLYTKIK